jgi:TolA protein
MKLAITARIRKKFDRFSVRITIGLVFSLLLHGLILSLQLGLPGIGLPSLALPWSERHAITPELSVRIANVAGSPTVENKESPPPIDSKVAPKPQETITNPNQVVTDLPDARVRQAPSATNQVSEKVTKALKSQPANTSTERKTGSPPPEDQSSPAPANSQQEVIAINGDYPDTFRMPAPDLDDWWRDAPKFDITPIQIRPPEQLMPPTIALESPKRTIEQAQDPAPAVQKPTEQESFERPDENKAQEQEKAKEAALAAEAAERKKGEELAAQEAARKQAEEEAAKIARDMETRKQEEATHAAEEAARQLAEKKLEEEKVARLEQEAAARKQEEERIQKQLEADRQAKELAARKQAEELASQKAAALALERAQEEQKREAEKQLEVEKAAKEAQELAARKEAEEIAQKKAAELEKQQQETKLAEERKARELAAQQEAQRKAQELAQQKARELEAQQKAEADAAAQREIARANAAAAAAAASASKASNNAGTSTASTSSTANASSNGNANGNGSGSQSRGSVDLASRALEQIGRMDKDRIAAPSSSDQPEEDTRHHSFLGMIDHDVVVDAYVRSWRNKIERNGSLNYSQSSRDLAREDPVVTVSIRSNGSVEDIVINRSSGRYDLDEAVKRIVRVNAPYSVFPESLARKYPVIEIRRVWSFAETLRLLEEIH